MNKAYEEKLQLVKAMHAIVLSMNNESAYMAWIYEMPDEPSEEDFQYFAEPENQSSFDDLTNLFIRLSKKYMSDGLYIGKTLYTGKSN